MAALREWRAVSAAAGRGLPASAGRLAITEDGQQCRVYPTDPGDPYAVRVSLGRKRPRFGIQLEPLLARFQVPRTQRFRYRAPARAGFDESKSACLVIYLGQELTNLKAL